MKLYYVSLTFLYTKKKKKKYEKFRDLFKHEVPSNPPLLVAHEFKKVKFHRYEIQLILVSTDCEFDSPTILKMATFSQP